MLRWFRCGMPLRRLAFGKQTHMQGRRVYQSNVLARAERSKLVREIAIQQTVAAVRQDHVDGEFLRDRLQHLQGQAGHTDESSLTLALDIAQRRQSLIDNLPLITVLD